MTCHIIEPLLEEYALGTLSPTECVLVEQHLATHCDSCLAELRDLEVALSNLAFTLTPQRPPDRVKAELLVKIRAQQTADSAGNLPNRLLPNIVTHSSDNYALAWFSAAICFGLMTISISTGWSLGRTSPQQVAQSTEQQYLHTIEQEQATFAKRPVTLVMLRKTDAELHVGGMLVWDHLAGQIHFVATTKVFVPSNASPTLWLRSENNGYTRLGALTRANVGSWHGLFDLPKSQAKWTQAILSLEENNSHEVAGPVGPKWLISDLATPGSEGLHSSP